MLLIIFIQLIWISYTSSFLEEDRYIILAIDGYGLANRFRTIADWYLVAIATKRTLLVSWKPTVECNVTLPQLIKSAPPEMKVLPFVLPDDIDQGNAFVKDACDRKGLTFKSMSRDPGDEVFVWPQKDVKSNINVLLTYYNGVLTLENTPCQYYFSKRSEFLLSLVPVDEVTEIVQQIKANYFKNRIMIGIHFRTHDARYDWSVIPPLKEGQNAMNFGEGASFEDFKKLMTSISNHFQGVDSSYVRFFIASNSDDAKRAFTSHFPESVTLYGDLSRNSADGIRFAFVEWLLLSDTSFIINTHGSSYAMEAASRSQVPIIGILGGNYIYHSDVRLPYCGHLQYIRWFSQQGVDTKFVESGTVDNRVVSGVVVAFRESTAFQHWGIPIVYSAVNDEEAKLAKDI